MKRDSKGRFVKKATHTCKCDDNECTEAVTKALEDICDEVAKDPAIKALLDLLPNAKAGAFPDPHTVNPKKYPSNEVCNEAIVKLARYMDEQETKAGFFSTDKADPALTTYCRYADDQMSSLIPNMMALMLSADSKEEAKALVKTTVQVISNCANKCIELAKK